MGQSAWGIGAELICSKNALRCLSASNLLRRLSPTLWNNKNIYKKISHTMTLMIVRHHTCIWYYQIIWYSLLHCIYYHYGGPLVCLVYDIDIHICTHLSESAHDVVHWGNTLKRYTAPPWICYHIYCLFYYVDCWTCRISHLFTCFHPSTLRMI